MEFLRTQDGSNQTAFVHLIRPSDGRRVDILGCIHFGPENYWENMRVKLMVAELGGFEIHYEMAKAPDPGSVKLRLRDITKIVVMMLGMKAIQRAAKRGGWVAQQDAIFYKETWKHNDLDIFASLRDMKMRTAFRILGTSVFLGFIISSVMKHAPQTLFKALIGGDTSKTATASGSVLGSESLLGDRNIHAVAEALKSDKDVMLLWGAAHIPGMVEILKEQGFVISGTDWITHSESTEA